MKEPEDLLRAPALAGPSPEHMRRMEDLFRPQARRSFLRRPVPLWQCAVACALCAVFAVLAWNSLQAPSSIKNEYTENVYYVVGFPDDAAPAPAAARSGFLTNPKGIQMRVYSISHEEAAEPAGKI